MKAHREPPKFTPVTLVLETQEEVDSLAAILECRQIRLAAGFDEPVYSVLAPFKSASVEQKVLDILKLTHQ